MLKDKVNNYQVPNGVKEILDNGQTVFLVGVTGAGKDTIMKRLLENPDYKLIISHTTRAPRQNHGVMEQDGYDYHFIDLPEAERMIDAGEYVEAKYVHGNVYGTSVKELKQAHNGGKIAIADIEVQGVAEYCALSANVTPIFILPPSYNEWLSRLSKRYGGNISQDDMKIRLRTAAEELNEAVNKSYFEFVINDNLDLAIPIVDQIAHGHKSKTKNNVAREHAKDLLVKLQSNLV